VLGAGRHARALKSVTLALPAGLSIDKHKLSSGLKLTLDGRAVPAGFRLDRGRLTITFRKTGRVAIITIAGPALSLVPGAAVKKLTLAATVRDAAGRATTLRLRGSAR
jgi:hypothetical protein